MRNTIGAHPFILSRNFCEPHERLASTRVLNSIDKLAINRISANRSDRFDCKQQTNAKNVRCGLIRKTKCIKRKTVTENCILCGDPSTRLNSLMNQWNDNKLISWKILYQSEKRGSRTRYKNEEWVEMELRSSIYNKPTRTKACPNRYVGEPINCIVGYFSPDCRVWTVSAIPDRCVTAWTQQANPFNEIW